MKLFKSWIRYKKDASNYGGGRNCIKIFKEDGNVITNPLKIKGIKIDFSGGNNYLEIHEPCNFSDCYFLIGNGSNIVLKKIKANKLIIIAQDKAKVLIDEGSTFGNTELHLHNETGTSIVIGKDCMFSIGIKMWTSDGHTIINDNNKIINKAKSGIVIGNHVWIGYGVTILKQSKIADNCVVGARSVISGKFDTPNSIIAANKIIKTGINWDRKTPEEYENEK